MRPGSAAQQSKAKQSKAMIYSCNRPKHTPVRPAFSTRPALNLQLLPVPVPPCCGLRIHRISPFPSTLVVLLLVRFSHRASNHSPFIYAFPPVLSSSFLLFSVLSVLHVSLSLSPDLLVSSLPFCPVPLHCGRSKRFVDIASILPSTTAPAI